MNPSMCGDDPIWVPEYKYCDECDRLAQEFEEARQEAINAAADAQRFVYDGEAWATGKRDGIPVPPSDEAYQNNAEYYKDVTETIASTASDSESHAAQSATQASNSANAALNASASAHEAQLAAEAAAEAAASVFSVVGNVTFTVLETGQVREIWTKEE